MERLKMMNSTPPFILASSSPRRKELLADAGFNFDVAVLNTDESFSEDLSPTEVVTYLAKKKLLAAKDLQNTKLVLTADTLVYKGDKILGKPKDIKEAVKMLTLLSGSAHEVTTSVCLGYKEQNHQFSTTTKVYFRELEISEIDYYIKHYRPFDKAGAYGIQEWIGSIGIHRIEGSYTNVVGLPMEETYSAIIEFSKKWLAQQNH